MPRGGSLSAPRGKRTYRAFLWHAGFLALTATFTDINTVMPSLVVESGGTSFHLGLLTAIMVGVPILGQLLFASYLHLKPRKTPYLLLGIYLRVVSLAAVGVVLWKADRFGGSSLMVTVFALMFVFSLSGAFAGVSYTDVLGKALPTTSRKRFFVHRQVVNSLAVLASALVVRQVLLRLDYPDNYRWLFLMAAGLLFVAAIGFWFVQEVPAEPRTEARGFVEVLRSIPGCIRGDPRLRNWIIVMNLTGFGLTLMPFYVALARDQYGLSSGRVGTFLFVQIVGMIVSNLLWAKVVKRWGFAGVVVGCILCGAALPLAALFLSGWSLSLFLPVFFVMGVVMSARRIGFEGLFIEFTNDENRALYKGIVGATSLSAALFPLVAGALIDSVGFGPVLLSGSILIASAVFFMRPLLVGPAPVDPASSG